MAACRRCSLSCRSACAVRSLATMSAGARSRNCALPSFLVGLLEFLPQFLQILFQALLLLRKINQTRQGHVNIYPRHHRRGRRLRPLHGGIDAAMSAGWPGW